MRSIVDYVTRIIIGLLSLVADRLIVPVGSDISRASVRLGASCKRVPTQLSSPSRLEALDGLLKDKILCKNLVKGAKDANLSLTLQYKPAKPKSTHSKKLLPSCTVNSTVLEHWSNDPSNFWVTSQPQLDPGKVELAAIYDETIKLQTRHEFDSIRLRFRKLFYHDLLYLLNPRACNKTTSKVYDQLARTISRKSTITKGVDEIQSQLTAWVRGGRRYHKLTTTFGTAILFVLPDSLSIDFLEKRLPLEDEAYKTTAQSLAPLKGYVDKLTGAEVVAQRLRESALDPFKFLEMEFSTLTLSAPTDSQAQQPQNGCRERPSSLTLSRLGHGEQGRVQCSAIPVDLRITEVENESDFEHRTGESQLQGPPLNLFGEDYSLEYYNDPFLFDEGHTLEYYLNVHSPTVPPQSPVVQSVPTPQHANTLSPLPMITSRDCQDPPAV